ncbi:MAG TPA: group II intron reverse transcriptase/maturase [Thermoanaerobaculaceae bacterium]|nr:group II intron reverse transcriptase/maturase [Thermoanaerobaculaceae bacterium]
MPGTQSLESISPRLDHIATVARQRPGEALTALAHHIDLAWLHEAYRRTRKDGAKGVDHVTAAQYAVQLEASLTDLLNRFKSGRYLAPPVRRVHIPKGDGTSTRPIGIPTFEDKILQRAAAMVLEAVYEPEFLECSYGFRPGRSAHQALQRVWRSVMEMGGAIVLDVDIRSFFDRLDHGHLRAMLDRRVRDGVIRRSIDKWLHAGVLEEGAIHRPASGTPQGGVISPLLANIYLHEVVDTWFVRDVRPRMRGRAELIRFADDLVLIFERQDDARRVLDVLPKRLGKYGLELHPDKTRLVDFRRPSSPGRTPGPGPTGRSGTFDFLGFTHYWGVSRNGNWVVKRKTAATRLRRALRAVHAWCRRHRHEPVKDQHRMLCAVLRGHYQYYGITGNAYALDHFRTGVLCTWRTWLNRRSQQASMHWKRFTRLLTRYPLPPARVVHSIYRTAANLSC